MINCCLITAIVFFLRSISKIIHFHINYTENEYSYLHYTLFMKNLYVKSFFKIKLAFIVTG